jgi:hypothetical protein
VQSKVNQIFAQTGDVNQATALAMAYIRGTPWYAQTYPGIQEGIARGVIGNEADYRSYLNSVNGLTQQYQGRQVGSDELAGYLQQGFSVDHVGRLYAGKAYVGANRNDIQYATGAFDAQGPLSDRRNSPRWGTRTPASTASSASGYRTVWNLPSSASKARSPAPLQHPDSRRRMAVFRLRHLAVTPRLT